MISRPTIYNLKPLQVGLSQRYFQNFGVAGGGQKIRYATMCFDPCARVRSDPRSHFKDALVVPFEVPGEDRLVVSNPVSEGAQEVQRYVSILAGDACGMRKHVPERWTPERHLIMALTMQRYRIRHRIFDTLLKRRIYHRFGGPQFSGMISVCFLGGRTPVVS